MEAFTTEVTLGVFLIVTVSFDIQDPLASSVLKVSLMKQRWFCGSVYFKIRCLFSIFSDKKKPSDLNRA